MNSQDTDQRENELCRAAKKGDLTAASELLDRYYERIFLWFRRLCGNEADAQDLTQKTFSKVWNSLAAFEERCSLSTWIHRIGHHLYIDWRRKGNRLEESTEEWWLSLPSNSPTPFEDAMERDLAQTLYGLVEQLEEDLRATVHIHYYEGLSLAETADVMDVATGTVKYRLRLALNQLRSRLDSSQPHIQPREGRRDSYGQ